MQTNSKYQPYDPSDIDTLLREPWEVSDQPYKLHAAYALSSLYDLCAPEDDEGTLDPDSIWGCKVYKKMLDHLVADITTDFNDAATNRKPVKIWGRGYTIRKVNAYDPKRINQIFNFPLKDDAYLITKEGVMDLRGTPLPGAEKYEITRENAKANRSYLRKIILMAEDDDNDGWDKLTDMEAVVYCWAMFYNKHQYDNFTHFKKEYKDYLYAPEKEILGCLNEKSSMGERPIGMYAFSYSKVMQWNGEHGQESLADKIPEQEAEDYWYNVALKTTFKPIDLR